MSRKSKAAAFANETYSVSVIGRNVTVTDSLRNYVEEKISKLERFSDRIIEAVVTMDVQKVGYRVDVVIRLEQVKIKAHAVCDDMYAAIDKVTDRIESQFLRYKGKLHDHHARDVASIDMSVNVLHSIRDDEIIEINKEIEEEDKKRLLDKYRPHKIVSKEVLPLKTLTDGEALMKMDLSGDAFLIYRSEESRALKILYRRNDGNFGLIEPEK